MFGIYVVILSICCLAFHADGGRCTGFLFPLFWTLHLGSRRGAALRPDSPPGGLLALPVTLRVPRSHENQRPHVLMSNKCLSDKIWLLSFGVLSHFYLAFALFFFLTCLWVHHHRSNFIFLPKYIVCLYSLPRLFFATFRCFHLNALPRTLTILWKRKTLCPSF